MSERVFFKATRPDGCDFRTGTIRYEVGETPNERPGNSVMEAGA